MSEKFTIKCNNCGATYEEGKLYINFVNTSMWDDVDEGALFIECNECRNKQKMTI